MDLTLQQLRAITLGALDIRHEEDGFCFSRMTETQSAAFIRANYTFEPKCKSASGVRLDFKTDSSFLKVRWHKTDIAKRTYCFFDVLVDGELMLHSGTPDCVTEPQGDFWLALPEGMHRIQIFLPTVVGIRLDSVVLSDDAKVIPSCPAKRILLHGDSITQGYDAMKPSGCYANILARHYDAEILNQAVGGAGFDSNVVEQVGEFDFAVVSYGTNDWSHKDALTFCADAASFFDRFRVLYPQLKAYVILPIWRADVQSKENTAGDFKECRTLIQRIATRRGFVVLDDYDMVPHDSELFFDKRLHPNDEGFVYYADRLIKLLGENPG